MWGDENVCTDKGEWYGITPVFVLARLARGEGVEYQWLLLASVARGEELAAGPAKDGRGMEVRKLGLASADRVGNTPIGAAPPPPPAFDSRFAGENLFGEKVVLFDEKRLGDAWTP
jgi:hypothetical protein